MRIAFVVGEFPALSETFILDQITGLMARGHTVDICAERPRAETPVHPDVTRHGLLAYTRYERMPSPVLRAIGLAVRLGGAPRESRRVLLRALQVNRYGMLAGSLRLFYNALPFLPPQSYDVIHAHFGPNGLKAARVRQIGALRGKLVTTFHGSDIEVYPSRHGAHCYDPLFATGDLFLPISARWNDRLAAMGCPSGKIVVHPMGVDLRRFPQPVDRAGDGGPVRIVTVGRLVEMKGIEYGIRAVADLVRRGVRVEYAIAGDGPLRRAFEGIIAARGAESSIHLLGACDQDQIAELLNRADLFLCPSVKDRDGRQEGVPVAVMEAMAAGLPVVGTCQKGIVTLVQEGVTGWVVPEKDVAAIAARLADLVANQKQRRAMGIRARARVESDYDIDRLNARLVEIYRALAGD